VAAPDRKANDSLSDKVGDHHANFMIVTGKLGHGCNRITQGQRRSSQVFHDFLYRFPFCLIVS